MSEDSVGAGGRGSSPGTAGDPSIAQIGDGVQRLLSTAGLAPPPDSGALLARMVGAFVRIKDPRVRAEVVALVEAIGGRG